MEKIKRTVHKIDEEIRDAETYARWAIEAKEYPEESRTYQALSSSELEHAGMLHNLVVGLIEKERAMNGEPPAGMLEAYDLIHEWQIERVSDVRAMIQLARE